ncbi:putative leader peptide [Streptomyces sp. cg28]|uniref:putative leader peptide n=1 Tax=Streptomyces sp. cg28 TaxID=3403457 RepID=UPI003B21E75B
MGRAPKVLGGDAFRVAVRQLPLLTSRRHIDLARVSSAAMPPHPGRPAPAHA